MSFQFHFEADDVISETDEISMDDIENRSSYLKLN